MNPEDAYSSFFQKSAMPVGYTPDTLSAYFKSSLAPIQMQTDQNVGSAQTGAVARGLAGTPTETGAMGTAKYYGDLAKGQAFGNLAMNMAGLSNQDALIKQQQQWQSGEAALDRAEKEKLARMGYDFEGGMASTLNRYGYQSAIAGLPAALGGAALGGWAGGGFKH